MDTVVEGNVTVVAAVDVGKAFSRSDKYAPRPNELIGTGMDTGVTGVAV